MKKLLMAGFILAAITTTAQVTDVEGSLKKQTVDTIEGWKTGGVISLTMSQAALSNWAAGGQNSMALNGVATMFAKLKKGDNQWDNTLDIGYGLLRQGEEKDFQKSDDKIDLASKYGRKAFGNLYYSGLVNAKTQFSAGYNYPNDSVKISEWMAPAYLTLALGLDYKPNTYFSAFLAPVTGRFTFVNDETLANVGAFGVDPAKYDTEGNLISNGSHLRKEFGGYFKMVYTRNNFKNEALKNVGIMTKLDLFSNYLKNPQNIDVSWETLIGLKVNKFLTVNFSLHLVYDDDVNSISKDETTGVETITGPKLQVKEILGVGLAYRF